MGHILAFSSVFFWSALYVSAKILLDYFSALELLILQFIIGYAFLLLLKPRALKLPFKQERWFMLAGFFGIMMYNLFLNLAFEYSPASNVSVIIATAPLFSGIFAFIFRIDKPYVNFFIGFVICIVGISIVSFSGVSELKLNPLGDNLALISAMGWGIYSIIIVKIMDMNLDIIIATRKVVFWGIVFILPCLFFLDFNPNLNALLESKVLFNLIFLSIFASGVCFMLFNKATLLIGALKTNIYVYLTPIITIITSMIVLDERLTWLTTLGIFLTLSGVIISEIRGKSNKFD